MDDAAAREKLADALEAERDISERVVDAIRAVPRHAFVPEEHENQAYRDQPLPIGNDQTVSAPHIVAVMCDRLNLEAGEDVLEIGTGCGYHAAVMAELVGADHVFSVEYDPELAADARENLADAGYSEVAVREGDGREGWSEHAPYDAAYLTCAAPEFPAAVVEQLRVGGRLLGPLDDGVQRLVFAHRTEDGLEREHGAAVRFVRMR